MPFDLITLAEPVVEPPKPEKTYPIGWLETFTARVTSGTEGTGYYEVRPMAMDGAKHPFQTVQRNIPNIWELAAAVPSVGVAVAALVTAVKDAEAYYATLEEEE